MHMVIIEFHMCCLLPGLVMLHAGSAGLPAADVPANDFPSFQVGINEGGYLPCSNTGAAMPTSATAD